MARVFVAMSGGVDSSVAAALLVEQGHEVTGVTMRLLAREDADGGCCAADGARSAKSVCATLGIPHYTLSFADEFERDVVTPYCDEYAAGRTPNPCVACNDRLKFSELLRRVTLQGADFLATGHYARVVRAAAGAPRLARAVDRGKDQSYFLYRMSTAQLEHTLFPLGELTKAEVREHARRRGLSSAERPESQDACFVAGGDVRAFLRERRPAAFRPGPVVDEAGALVGAHEGVCGVTVGQRRGLGLDGAPGLFVRSVDVRSATIHVAERSRLVAHVIEASDAVWGDGPGPGSVTVRVRYRGPEAAGTARLEHGRLIVHVPGGISAPAPGQALVCYRGDVVAGGGVVEVVS